MLSQGTVTANGITFTYLEAGPPDGPLALCLHGFPDSAQTWRHLLPALGGAGYHAVAPWMRGYAPTELAPDANYQRGALSADALALHEALDGDERAVLIGHDWGALAAYGAAAHEPHRWRRVVTMAVPPLATAGASLLAYDQLKRSFYIFLFQTPLAEPAVGSDDLRFIERLWADWSPGYDATDDLAHVKSSLREHTNLSAAIGYYRAMFDPSGHDPAFSELESAAFRPITVPLQYLHGTDDGCMALPSLDAVRAQLVEGSEVVAVERAGHFLHVEQPDEVATRVLQFLGDA